MFRVKEDTITPLAKKIREHTIASSGVTYKMAKEVVETIQQRAYSGRLGVPAKSPEWAKRSGSDLPLIGATRQYIAGLNAVKLGRRAAIQGNVRLALMLEFGTKNMVPRPHIGPTLREFNPRAAELFEEEFINELLSG